MDKLRVDLTEYLVKDEVYNWVYTNDLIKKQMRSMSLDNCQGYVE